MKPFLKKLESTYNIKLPERYKTFILNNEYQNYPSIKFSGYFKGSWNLHFTDDLLLDVAELGIESDIQDIDDVPWNEDYANYVPLAFLTDPDDDRGDFPRMFLVIDVRTQGTPVLAFASEGWSLYPVAGSFDEFLKMLPAAKTDISASFRPGIDED